MKGFEFYTPSLNAIAASHNREERIKNVVNQLYNTNTYKCTKCGMRYQSHSELKVHLDYHFQQNVLATERRSGPLTRKPYSTYLNWISDSNIDIIHQSHETMTREQQELQNSLPFSSVDSQCVVCREDFKTVLKDDDEWYFINCKKIKVNHVPIKVHFSNCAKIIEEQISKFTGMKEKPKEEEEIDTSHSSQKK
eukprot:CAMPEP_0168339730 /NCGR_PEP_ID=MMETSP0213-20121227/13635_1 /TAXON_ID=151035 /ORGANISM="Euplotes harpa, Strain FSP1.4" /LENGTH=193 /DNA_ID=CAMNT_0008345817 /DNA_START=87 /DNA_END=668 /DNA_ORIENTATION=+